MSPGTESPLERLRRLEAEDRAARAAAARPAAAGRPGGGPAPAPKRRGILATIWGAIALVLAKAKLLVGFLKLGPLLKTFATLGLSASIYARFYGPKLAIGFVLLILVHEYGHGIAAKIMGLRVGAPIFIPFFGAVIALKDQPRTTWVDAVVGFGGPFAGMFGGAAVLAAGLIAGEGPRAGLLVVLAWMTFLINLFNLMPVFGLDGDRITQPFRPWYWIPGCLVVLGLGLADVRATGSFHPSLLLILVLGAIKGSRLAFAQRRARRGDAHKTLLERVTHRDVYVDEATVQPWQRAASGWAYFGLLTSLCVLLLWSQRLRPSTVGM